MKQIQKLMPYKLRRLMLLSGIVGLTLSSCSKDDETPVPQHDTVYVWGIQQLPPADKIAASADSASVRYVILQSDGLNWGKACNGEYIVECYITPSINATAEKNRNKLRGRGDLYNIRETGEDARIWLQNFGFTIVEKSENR